MVVLRSQRPPNASEVILFWTDQTENLIRDSGNPFQKRLNTDRYAQVSYKLTFVDSYKEFAFPVKYSCFLLLSTDQYFSQYDALD